MDKKATINTINRNDNKCFQYAAVLALNHKGIRKDSGRITKTKLFIDKYNWEERNYPSEKDDWNWFEEDDLTVAPNVLYAKNEKIYPAYI